MWNIQRLGHHHWQDEWITFMRGERLWDAVAYQQYREYVLGKPTRVS